MTTKHKLIINNHINAFYKNDFDVEQGLSRQQLDEGITSRALWCKMMPQEKKILRSSGILTTFGDLLIRERFRELFRLIGV